MVRVVKRQQQPQPAPAAGGGAGEAQSAEEIMRQIEALKLQIQSAQQQQQQQQQSAPAIHQQQEEEDEYTEEYEEVIEEELVEDEVPASPQGRVRRVNKPAPSPPQRKAAATAAKSPVAANRGPPPAPDDSYRKQMDSLKSKYAFEKPGWAAPDDVVNKEAAIDCDSINNPKLKKPQMDGYVRQVFEKDLDIVKGKHVKPEATVKLEPRMTWIVVNVNKRKVGKIVMHLYGQDVAGLVDQFVELKGHSIERGNGMLAVVGQQPTLYVTAGGASGLDGRSGVYGVILEGHDIFQTVMAADADAVLTVKQAHIYPVKKGKSG